LNIMGPITLPNQNASNHALDVFSLILDMYFSMSLQEVAHLGIADLLRDGPKPTHELAQQVGVQEDVLLLLLRVMCSKDVFIETEPGIFAQTERSRYLQSDIPGSMLPIAEVCRAEWHRKAWTPEALTYTLQTGKSGFEHVFGEDVWAYLTKHPMEYAVFSRAMTSRSVVLNETVAQACDLTGLRSLADIGGGEGSFLSTLLLRYPEMTGTLFDAPVVAERAQALIAETGLTDRCTCIGGDFLQGVPEGRDAYVLRHVLHDWSDEDCLRILRNCRQAIAPFGKLFIIEFIHPEPPYKPSPFFVLSMVLRQTPGGHHRTVQQFRHMLNNAGFELVGVTPTGSNDIILEAKARD
jgi:hypothetical protein